MDKNILIQYTDLKEEIKELRDKIDRMERQIKQMENKGSVKDRMGEYSILLYKDFHLQNMIKR